jgi:hypothetical protein
MSTNSLVEFRKRLHSREKDYINSLRGFNSIDICSYTPCVPYVKTNSDIFFCNQKVDKCAIIQYRKHYYQLKKLSRCKPYRKRFEKIYDCDKKQTILFLDKPNIQVYIGYSKKHGVYFKLRSPALYDDVILLGTEEYQVLTDNVCDNRKQITNIYKELDNVYKDIICLDTKVDQLEDNVNDKIEEINTRISTEVNTINETINKNTKELKDELMEIGSMQNTTLVNT